MDRWYGPPTVRKRRLSNYLTHLHKKLMEVRIWHFAAMLQLANDKARMNSNSFCKQQYPLL